MKNKTTEYTTVTFEGAESVFGTPHDDDVEIEGVVVLGYDPELDKWLGIRWRDSGTLWLVGGGKELKETYFESAVRELGEEAGFYTYQKAIQLGGRFQAHYYNERKDSHRRGIGYAFLFYLDPKDQKEQALEAHENFDTVWLPFDELYAEIVKTGGGVEHWLELLRRAQTAVTSNNT